MAARCPGIDNTIPCHLPRCQAAWYGPDMDTRYSHPIVAMLWSPAWTYGAWRDIERATLCAQLDQENHPVRVADVGSSLVPRLNSLEFNAAHVVEIQAVERLTKHDVAAFLEWLRARCGPSGRWLHYGLTSSDVVDTAQALRFKAMHEPFLNAVTGLVHRLVSTTANRQAVIGRTHGQVAEMMQMRARARHWLGLVEYAMVAVNRTMYDMQRCKLSGPVGTYAHNGPEVEKATARILGLMPHGPGASQIASRAPLAAWASGMAQLAGACSKIATDIRLMRMTGEAMGLNDPGQIGSSAMAHKVNPIREEQIGGLARLAQGYASMLQPIDGWLERDLVHSSVERVAVPDLWHVVLRLLEQAALAVSRLTIDNDRVADLAGQTNDVMISTATLDRLAEGMDIDQARADALATAPRPIDPDRVARKAMARYPGPAS